MNLKTSIDIDNIAYDFEIYALEEGIITGIKFDNRIFICSEKNNGNTIIKQEENNIIKISKKKPRKTKKTKRNKNWSKKEIKLLKEYYPIKDTKDLLLLFPDRNLHAIQDKASDLKIHKIPKNLRKNKNIEKHVSDHNRAPNNTMLFLNWLHNYHVKKFSTTDFINKYSYISRENAEKIINHQISIGHVVQLGPDKFTTNDHLKEIGRGNFINQENS